MHTTKTFLFLIAASTVSAACFGLSGCGSKDSTAASSGGPTTCFDYSTYAGTTPTRSFTTDVLPILRRSCGLSSSCHGDPSVSLPNQPYYGPSLSDPTPTASDVAEIFVGLSKASGENPPMPLVTPHDPSKSFLMYKLDGEVECALLGCAAAQSCGGSMPSGNPSLAADELDIFRSWIKQGAVNDFPGSASTSTTSGAGGSGAGGAGGSGGK